jgi:eukaryotic-like serine/threonine-protein kinase
MKLMSEAPKPSPGTRERELFLAALEQPTPTERAAYLESACAGDHTLRRRVEELLGEEEKVGGFLERPALSEPARPGAAFGGSAAGPGGTAVLGFVSEKPGDRIGRYKLLQQIGEGGCGVVYMAEQEEPVRRRVALKVIKLGMDTKTVIARFEAERQALAMMEHPNIAKVLDGGATETGRPFFVMELVRGVKITDYCDQNHLPPRERLALFIEVCQAIQHAHQKGIIHRDIKPSNILVTLHDGVPVPKVIDFGIAKATEQRLTAKTLFTEFTAFIGTPAYMSPEQAEMSGLDIDTRSDIYSLGVLLYELLTGKTPFDAQALLEAGLDECRRTIREKEPIRPSTRLETMIAAELTTTAQERHTEAPKLIHLLRGDLDWVVMKCLEKDRARRYDTATGLATDVQRYLTDEPVLARPPSNLYRLQKLLHRHRGVVAATAAIAATLLVGAGVSAWQAVRATRAEHNAFAAQQKESLLRRQAELETERAERAKRLAHLNEYVADINLAQKNLTDGNYGKAMQLLNKHLPQPGEPDLRGFEWRYLAHLCRGDDDAPLPTQDGPVQALACSPDGRWLAVGLRESLSIWDIRTKSRITDLPEGPFSLAFLPDGKTLVSGSPGHVRLWRTTDWAEQAVLPKSSGPISLSQDGSRLATESERQFPGPGRGRSALRIWDTSTWQEIKSLPGASSPMAFSPDNQTLAAEGREGITLWPLEEGRSSILLQDSTNLFFRPGPMFGSDHLLAFSPDGHWIVGARNTLSKRGVFVLSIWDAHSGEEKDSMPSDPEHVEHTGVISSLAFLPGGNTLVTASWDHSIRLWDFRKRQLQTTLQGHLNEVRTMAFFADGQTIVSGSKDGGVKLWKTEQPAKQEVLPGWEPLGFSADSSRLAVFSRPGTIAFYSLETGELEHPLSIEHERFGPRPPPPGAFQTPGTPANERKPPDGPPHGGPMGGGIGGPMRGGPMGGGMGGDMNLSFSADLSVIVQGLNDGMVKFWNTKTDETNVLRVAEGRVDLVALSPDGGLLVTGARFPTGHVPALHWWDLRTGTNGVLASEASRARFSPDGRILAAYQRDAGVELWDMVTHTLRTRLSAESPPLALAFSPDSQLVATTPGPEDLDNAVRIWDAQTGKEFGVCTGHKQAVWSVAFSPDGATLATASDDSTLRLWNVATQQELLSVRRLGGGLRGLRFSPDGQLLVGGSGLFAQKGGLQFFRAPLPSKNDASTINQPAARKRPSPR